MTADYHLVLTAHETTWGADDRRLLLLGAWCQRYDRKEMWDKRPHEVIPYHWDDREKLHNDYLYITRMYEKYLRLLTLKLNEIHAVDRSERYWRILVGPWLGYFTQILYDRWFMLNAALSNDSVTTITFDKDCAASLVPKTMNDFVHRIVSDEWNQGIYQDIFNRFYRNTGISVAYTLSDGNKIPPSQVNVDLKRQLLRRLGSLLLNCLAYLPNRRDIFLHSSFLPKGVEALVNIKLSQLPLFFTSGQLTLNADGAKRCWTLKVEDEGSRGQFSFEDVLGYMIPRHIPVCYAEGYSELLEICSKRPWPKRPKLLFTSNAYIDDDIWKSWAAMCVDDGAKLVIGQHGGHFGTSPFSFTEEHQIEISDKWLSWGWTHSNSNKVVPLGNFKDSARASKKRSIQVKGEVLLYQMKLPRYSYHMYAIPISSCQYQSYIQDVHEFFHSLKGEIQLRTVVRLKQNSYKTSDFQRWKDRFPLVKVDCGKRSSASAMSRARVVVATYNATTFLESLSLDIPTIIFWNPAHWELRPEALPYFAALETVGIFHRSPESASAMLNKVWDKVEDWWQSSEIQVARSFFCEKFSRKLEHVSSHLARELGTL